MCKSFGSNIHVEATSVPGDLLPNSETLECCAAEFGFNPQKRANSARSRTGSVALVPVRSSTGRGRETALPRTWYQTTLRRSHSVVAADIYSIHPSVRSASA